MFGPISISQQPILAGGPTRCMLQLVMLEGLCVLSMCTAHPKVVVLPPAGLHPGLPSGSGPQLFGIEQSVQTATGHPVQEKNELDKGMDTFFSGEL